MEKWKNNNKLKKVIASGVIIVPLISWYLKSIEEIINIKAKFIISIVIWLILIVIFELLKDSIITTKENSKIEVEGINLKKKDGTFGTADWGTREEIEEYLGIDKRDGIILGKTENDEIITLPLETYLNKNIAVFGSSGSKKSRGFAIPNAIELSKDKIKESIDNNMSLVFTDPKRRAL